jgi:hypothetical protein
VDHAEQLDRSFPWRGAALAAGAIAAAELVGLLALAGVRLAPSIHLHSAKTAAPPTTAATAARGSVPAHAAPAPARSPARAAARPLRPRSRISVLVLNGNGVGHAASEEAARLVVRGYRAATPADAVSHDYARSLVLFAPGYEREGRRLGRDAGVRTVTPLDGLTPSQLRGSQLVVILGGS